MDFKEYQELAFETAGYPESGRGSFPALAYSALGLAGESGEAVEHVKKAWRNDGVLTPERKAKLRMELGDVLWYVAALATEIEESLDSIAEDNIAKLFDRRERNVIAGEGDNR